MAPVAPERVEILVALGTDASEINSAGVHSGSYRLAPVDFPQVKISRLRGVTQNCVIFAKFCSDFRADLIATFSDTRSNGDMQILRAGGEPALHFGYGAGGDLPRRASPAGMNGGDGAMHGIDHEQRNAIRCFDPYEATRGVLQKSVAITQEAGAAARDYYGIGVNLVQGGKIAATAETRRPASAEAVHQPLEGLERPYPVDVLRVFVKHP